MSDTYEVFAIRYATNSFGYSHCFMGGDAHDLPVALDYFVWVLRNEARTILVDTGFGHAAAERRGRAISTPVSEGLEAAGVSASSVTDVIITHLHYDHAGNNDLFPDARFHLQEAEMSFATGPCMCHQLGRRPYEVDDVVGMVRRVYAGNVVFWRGDAEFCPGVTLHHIGGHSRGLQCVRVRTRRGPIVLASDTAHLYEHILRGSVFPVCDSVSDTLLGYDRVLRLGDADMSRIVPGHDPQVMNLFPALSGRTRGLVARLDQEWLRPPQSLAAPMP